MNSLNARKQILVFDCSGHQSGLEMGDVNSEGIKYIVIGILVSAA